MGVNELPQVGKFISNYDNICCDINQVCSWHRIIDVNT